MSARWGSGALLPMPGTVRGMLLNPVAQHGTWPPPAVGDQPPPLCSGLLQHLGVRRSAGPLGQVLEAALPGVSDQFGDLVRGQNQSCDSTPSQPEGAA